MEFDTIEINHPTRLGMESIKRYMNVYLADIRVAIASEDTTDIFDGDDFSDLDDTRAMQFMCAMAGFALANREDSPFHHMVLTEILVAATNMVSTDVVALDEFMLGLMGEQDDE